jgi:predicted ribosomally synthesized peptide with SipW-like signal peptide
MKKNVVISMLVIALAAALLGGATFAWFTSEKDFDAEFTAGTLVLNGDGLDFSISDIAPGWGTDGETDDNVWKITLTNNGSLKMFYRVYFEGTEGEELNPDLSEVLKVKVEGEGTDGTEVFVLLNSLFKDNALFLGDLEPENEVELTLTFQLPTTVGDEYQGASWAGKLYAQGTQKDHQDDDDIQWSN